MSPRIPVTDYVLFYEVIDGLPVRYMESIELAVPRRGDGGGRPVALLHSLAGGASTMEPLAAALAARGLAPVTVDLRGFGASHRPTLNCSAAVWAADLAVVLGALGLHGVPLVGHGFGACAALAAVEAGAAPCAVVSGVALAAGEPAGLASLADDGDMGEDVAAGLAALGVGAVAAADITPQAWARVARAWIDDAGPADRAALAGKLLVAAGERDAFTPAGAPGGAAELAAAAGTPLLTLPAGHDLPGEQPEALAAAISSFLDQVR